jgi:hypothetical protein
LANGELKNVNILGEISKFENLLGGGGKSAGGGSTTKLKQFSGTLNIVNGVATTNNLKAVTDEGSIAGAGSLNLVNNGIDMHMAGGIGGMTIPVLVTGTTDKMHFAPDMQALAKLKMGNVNSLINGLTGNKQGKQSNPLDSILGGLGKKKQ